MRFKHAQIMSAADIAEVLKSSENYQQVAGGWAFPAFCDNTDESHAVTFAAAAVKARGGAGKVVWKQDQRMAQSPPQT
jgi:hypothetical protein